ncbi:cyanophycin synthetase [Methylophaga frappieri]|uniref:Cyanophycin synthetase n=1 Tax=Methylophaga frappieri (strain ATCC BAA-2434 / DSM 25690 / JAM7) TaxID=754477 RepID=I1YF90_METFJ|nr:cyanophycin synthetase [Methylophaga frappieri]AFJ01583.1 cyanophycin synthetase [Methylophaga frappieri]
MNPLEQHQLALSLNLPETIMASRLAQWLSTGGFQYPADEDLFQINRENVSQQHQLLLKAWLLFHQNLLIDAGIPAFKSAEIDQIEYQENGRLRITISLFSFIEFRNLFVNALSQCFTFILKMNATPYSLEAFDDLGKRVEQQLYQPLKKVSNAGLSNIPILQYAYEHHIPMQYFGAGLYQLGWGANAHWLKASSTEEDSAIGAKLSGYKHFSAQRLKSLGLPAAQNALVKTIEQAAEFADEIGYPVVVKPEQGNRGEGVVKDITTVTQLKRAFEYSKSFNELVLIEKQVTGSCYRFFVYKNDVIYINGNLPRKLVGNGEANIAELIEADTRYQMTRKHWQRDPTIPLDTETHDCLRDQNLTLQSVPEKHQSIAIRKIGSMQWGTEDAPAVCDAHRDNIALAIAAAKAMNLATAGVDMIIEDVTRSWLEQTVIVNEINSSPMIGVSKASLDALPKLMRLMLPNQGRIPVTVFLGKEAAFDAARKAQQAAIENNIACYLTSHQTTLSPDQNSTPMTFETVSQRVNALMQMPSVAALIIVVESDSVLEEKWPVDQIDELVVVDNVNQAVEDFFRSLCR